MAYLTLETIPYVILSHITTISIIVLLVGIHLYIFQKLLPLTEFSFHLESIITKYEVWRLLSSQFVHASLFHIGFNLFALISYSFLESEIGFIAYIRLTFLLLLLCPLLQLAVYYILWKYFQLEQYRDSHSVGYSCVLFGLLTYACMMAPFSIIHLLGFIPLPRLLFPILALGITQILVPQASFIGHLSGLLLGIPLSVPVFVEWMNLYLILTSILLVICVLTINLRITRPQLQLFQWISIQPFSQQQNTNEEFQIYRDDSDVYSNESEDIPIQDILTNTNNVQLPESSRNADLKGSIIHEHRQESLNIPSHETLAMEVHTPEYSLGDKYPDDGLGENHETDMLHIDLQNDVSGNDEQKIANTPLICQKQRYDEDDLFLD